MRTLPKRALGSTYFYLEKPGENQALEWFRSLPAPPLEYSLKDSVILLHFGEFGQLVSDEAGNFDQTSSPVAILYLPMVRREVLWTVGEVHFTTEALRNIFPGLESIRGRFQRWLSNQGIAWERSKDGLEGHGYYLLSRAKNVTLRVYALPSGRDAYGEGQYFIDHGSTEDGLDDLCRTLRLHGVKCGSREDVPPP